MEVPDMYYVPPHLGTAFDPKELQAFIGIFHREDEKDGDADGYIEVDKVEELMDAAGEKITEKKKQEIIQECDPKKSGNIQFMDILRCLSRYRFKRDAFGGKRVISDEYPLPLRVETEYDLPCIQHPEKRAEMEDPANQTAAVLRTIFRRHDEDKSGEIEMHEVLAILEEHKVEFDRDELDDLFAKYDVDGSGTLDFAEFTEFMSDLKADKAIVEQRSVSYEVPAALKIHFTEAELNDLLVHFGMFDIDGGGSIAADELKQVLQDMGIDATDEQVEEVIAEIDKDKSGEIEFGEFVALMHKVNTGQLEIGASLLAQAVMDSTAGKKLAVEMAEVKENPIPGVTFIIDKRDPTTVVFDIDGPPDTPYHQYVLHLQVVVTDEYPYSPPQTFFTHRLLHINFNILLDGTTSMPQVTAFWDAEWNVRALVEYVLELLKEPNLSLLPPDYAHGTRHDYNTQHFDHRNPPGMDLRAKKKSSDFLAEVVYLYCEQKRKYDMMCRDFTRRFCDRKTYS